jgi:hypothetical protein
MTTLEELEKRIVSIETDVAREISQLKLRLFKSELRFASFLRWATTNGVISLDQYNYAIEAFQQLNTVVNELNSINSINDKVMGAFEFNKQSTIFKINADDLGIKEIIENAGGTSDFTARLILSKLPMSEMFKIFINQFIDPTKNPSPDAIIPTEIVQ